jgi:hypothetical protein
MLHERNTISSLWIDRTHSIGTILLFYRRNILSRHYEEKRKKKEGMNEGTGYNNNKNTAKNFSFIIYILIFWAFSFFVIRNLKSLGKSVNF